MPLRKGEIQDKASTDMLCDHSLHSILNHLVVDHKAELVDHAKSDAKNQTIKLDAKHTPRTNNCSRYCCSHI